MWDISDNIPGKMMVVSPDMGHLNHYRDYGMLLGREWRRGEGGVAAEFGFQRKASGREGACPQG